MTYKPFIDVAEENSFLLPEIKKIVMTVLDSGEYVLGRQVQEFEESLVNHFQMNYALGVSNGTDGLVLALKALNIKTNEEIVTVANSYLASASCIYLAGGKAIFSDVDINTGLVTLEHLQKVITSKTKAIILVHLGGYMIPDIEEIVNFCKRKGIAIIEDCSQAFGTEDENGVKAGHYSDIAVFSAHPLKNLGACGDAGFIVTNNLEYYDYIKKARTHGHSSRDDIDFISSNSRLDEIQAAILNIKLKHYDSLIRSRREKVFFYKEKLGEYFYFPSDKEIETSSHHLLIIQVNNRERLMESIMRNGYETKIHYPKPFYSLSSMRSIKEENLSKLINTEQRSKKILSLPIGAHINKKDISKNCKQIIDDY